MDADPTDMDADTSAPFETPDQGQSHHMDADPIDIDANTPTRFRTWDQGCQHAHQDRMPFIERFPSPLAGAPISNMGHGTPDFQTHPNGLDDNIWSPFQSQRDWDFAQWAKNRGSTSTAVTELLAMDGVSSTNMTQN